MIYIQEGISFQKKWEEIRLLATLKKGGQLSLVLARDHPSAHRHVVFYLHPVFMLCWIWSFVTKYSNNFFSHIPTDDIPHSMLDTFVNDFQFGVTENILDGAIHLQCVVVHTDSN